MEKRQTISFEALANNLIHEAGRLLGKDAGYLRDRITLHRVSGQHPNWGADIAAVDAYELPAFRQALESMLARFMTSIDIFAF
jgi:hypothetical protein